MNVLVGALAVAIVYAGYTALAAVGFSIQFATTGVLNLAYGDVMGIAGYTAYTVHQAGVSLWLGLCAGVIAATIATLAIGMFLILPGSRRGMGVSHLIMLTLGLSMIVEACINIVWGSTDVTFGIPAGSIISAGEFRWSIQDCGVVVASLVVISLTALVMTRSRLGKSMRAVAGNKPLALAYGIPADRVTRRSWLLSGILCGVAGVALMSESVEFTSVTGFTFTVVVLAAAFVGGIGSVGGAVLGSTIVAVATQLIAAYSDPAYLDVFAFLILIAVLLFRPRGIIADPSVQRDIVH